MNQPTAIAPPRGKLGVLMPGMGAVATTFIAGVEAVKAGLGKPYGSLTQMASIRLGKRTDNRSPRIKDFVPLAELDDLVFAGWDVFPDSAYEAARHAGVLDHELLDALQEPLQAVKPWKAAFDRDYVRRLDGPHVKEAKGKRQVILVTHNPNLAVVCDAEQIICVMMDKKNDNRITYTTGAIEEPEINKKIVEILEGTEPAFTVRQSKYQFAGR
jgi:hypothetical protein